MARLINGICCITFTDGKINRGATILHHLAENDCDTLAVYGILSPLIISGNWPVPKKDGRPITDIGSEIRDVRHYRMLKRNNFLTQHMHLWAHIFAVSRGAIPTPTPENTPEPENTEIPEPDTIPEPEPENVPEIPENDAENLFRKFYGILKRLRQFDKDRGSVFALDSMRAMRDGVKALKQGLPLDGIISSLTAAWSEDSRKQAGISEKMFDYTGWGRRNGSPKNAHGVAEYVARLVKADIPVLLTGPAGTGKSSAAKYAAEAAGLTYREVNLAGAMASAIKGKDRLKEFIESQFTIAYRDGGVLCIEEIDAAHPTVLTAINNAIAGDEFWNDADGKSYKRHPNFRLIATANTMLTGATKQFNGRSAIDGATRDRFRMGTVYTPLDEVLEESIFESMIAGA